MFNKITKLSLLIILTFTSSIYACCEQCTGCKTKSETKRKRDSSKVVIEGPLGKIKKRHTLKVKGAPVDQVLRSLMTDTNVKYHIVLKSKKVTKISSEMINVPFGLVLRAVFRVLKDVKYDKKSKTYIFTI